jgi:hypothetical protein
MIWFILLYSKRVAYMLVHTLPQDTKHNTLFLGYIITQKSVFHISTCMYTYIISTIVCEFSSLILHISCFRYFDSITSNLDNPIERKAYDLISILPNVHVYDVYDLNLDDKSGFGDMGSYPHCTKFAHLMLDADWVVHFDIDEAFSFKTPLDNEPDCDHSEYGIPVDALIDFTSTIPHDVSAVIFPRFGFNTNGIISPPESKSQMELYLQRLKRPEVGGKVLLRTKSIKTTYSFDKHRVISPVKGSVIYPSGLNASSDNCIEGKTCYYVDRRYPSEMYTSAPVLYHYTTRSVEECRDKVKGTEEIKNSTGYVSWRKNSGDICTEHYDNSNTDRDYALFCAGKAVSLELKGLFPAYDQSPFVF